MSRRMGRDKAWVEVGGRPLIRRVIDQLETVCDEIVVVVNDPAGYSTLGARLTGDIFPDKGSLGGIYSGLVAARFDRAVVVACDMPFLNPRLLAYMLDLAYDHDVVIPSAPDESKPARLKTDRPTAKDSNLHPLHAVYSKNCIGPIQARLAAGDLRVISFYPDVSVRVVTTDELDRLDPERLSLFNANTPEQVTLAEKRVPSTSL